jgi:hypothetical protein
MKYEKNVVSLNQTINDDEDDDLTLEGMLKDEDDYFESYIDKEYQI